MFNIVYTFGKTFDTFFFNINIIHFFVKIIFRLDLDASAFELLGGDAASLTDARVATIRVCHLMNHTAGLTDGGGMGTGGFADTSNPAATLAMLQKLTLSKAPGETFEYCNTGPNIVSRIIEVLSGQDYDAFVINRVWAPLGITTPVVSSMYRPHEGEVPFYHPTRPGQISADKSNLYWKYLWGGRAGSQGNRELGLEGAGGWKGPATALALLGADLLASLQGAPSAKLLTAETVKVMMGSQYATPMGEVHYALGFINWAKNPSACTVGASAVEWEAAYAQWMHGGTFGSALHVETGGGGVSWAFCLNAPPHFATAHEQDHIAEPDGLKAQLRKVFQSAMFSEGVRF